MDSAGRCERLLKKHAKGQGREQSKGHKWQAENGAFRTVHRAGSLAFNSSAAKGTAAARQFRSEWAWRFRRFAWRACASASGHGRSGEAQQVEKYPARPRSCSTEVRSGRSSISDQLQWQRVYSHARPVTLLLEHHHRRPGSSSVQRTPRQRGALRVSGAHPHAS